MVFAEAVGDDDDDKVSMPRPDQSRDQSSSYIVYRIIRFLHLNIRPRLSLKLPLNHNIFVSLLSYRRIASTYSSHPFGKSSSRSMLVSRP